MKKYFTAFLAVIIAITTLVFTSCTKKIETQSHTLTTIKTAVNDNELRIGSFISGYAHSDEIADVLWFTAADTGLKVTSATKEILNQYENYVTYIDESVPTEYKIIFTSANTVELEYLAVRLEYSEAQDYFYLVEDASLTSSIIKPNTPFVVNWQGVGIFPNRAVAFYDDNNIKKYFTISGNDSDEGAPILLIERQARESDLINKMWRFESGNHLLFFQSNVIVEFISDGSIVRVYHVNEDGSYNLINEGTWKLTSSNNLFIEGEKGAGGGTPGYSFTFIIRSDLLIITDHIDNTASFRYLGFQG